MILIGLYLFFAVLIWIAYQISRLKPDDSTFDHFGQSEDETNHQLQEFMDGMNQLQNQQLQEFMYEMNRQQDQQFQEWSLDESMKEASSFENGGYDMMQGNSFNEHNGF